MPSFFTLRASYFCGSPALSGDGEAEGEAEAEGEGSAEVEAEGEAAILGATLAAGTAGGACPEKRFSTA
jgi:hypothetical protein